MIIILDPFEEPVNCDIKTEGLSIDELYNKLVN
jgi:hypothetical protein